MSRDIVDTPASQFVLFWGAGFALSRAQERPILFQEALLAGTLLRPLEALGVVMQEHDGPYGAWRRGFVVSRQH